MLTAILKSMNRANKDLGLPNLLSDRLEETVACGTVSRASREALRHTPTKFCTKHSTTMFTHFKGAPADNLRLCH